MADEKKASENESEAEDKIFDKSDEDKSEEKTEDKSEEKDEEKSDEKESKDESKKDESKDGDAEKKAAKAEGKDEDSKKGEERVVPKKYDLKLPEDSPLTESDLERVAASAKEQKLTNEEAQSLLDDESSAVKTYVTGQEAKLAEKSKEWIALAKADKEIGGESFDKSAELAKTVVNKFGSDALKKGLNETGFGNHPELVRMLVRIGKTMKSDDLVLPGTAPTTKKSIEEVFYGQTKD